MSGAGRLDEDMGRVVISAAGRIVRNPEKPNLRERMIEEALIDAWRDLVPGGEARRTVSLAVPDWDPQPAQTDFAAALPDAEFPSVIAEIKIDHLDQTLWDLFKGLSVAEHAPGIERFYLIAAAYPSRWTSVQCSQLFAPEPQPRTWTARKMFSDWGKAWANLLQGGSARPRRVHAEIQTTFIWNGPVPAFHADGYELRCVAVEAVPDTGWLAFKNDWPALTPAQERMFGDDGGGPPIADLSSLTDEQIAAIADGRQKEEQQRTDRLRTELAAWEEAQRIRRYVEALRDYDFAEEYRDDVAEWAAWAELHADGLDPFRNPRRIQRPDS